MRLASRSPITRRASPQTPPTSRWSWRPWAPAASPLSIRLARTYLRRGLLVEPFPVAAPSPWTYYLTESQLSKGNVVRTVKGWILAQASREVEALLASA